MNKSFIFNALILSLIVITACGKKPKAQKRVDLHPDMGMYISAFSSGHLNHNQSVEIYFTDDFVDTATFDDSYLSFEPKQSGKISWPAPGVLRYTPNEAWMRNTFYTAKLSLKEFLDVPAHVAELNFQFYVPDIQLEIAEIFIEQPQKDQQTAKIFLQISEDISHEALKNAFQLELQSKKIDFKILQDPLTRQPIIETQEIPIEKDKKPLLLTWNFNEMKSNTQGQETFLLPNNQNFNVFNHRIYNGDKPVIEVNFTQKLKSKFDYSGLMTLNRMQISNYEISGNTLRIFLDKKLNGNQTLELYQGFASEKAKFSKIVRVPLDFGEKFPSVTWLNAGNIVPGSGQIKVAFKAENLKSVQLKVIKLPEGTLVKPFDRSPSDLEYLGEEVHTEKLILSKLNSQEESIYALELENLISPEPGALYHLQMSFSHLDADLPCLTQEAVRKLPWPSKNEREDHFYDNYNYRDRNNPCTPSYYSSSRFIGKLILASDLGIMAKLAAGNELTVSVQDLKTTDAIQDVSLTAYNKKQQQVGRGITNSSGIAQISCSDEPNYLVAQKGKQRNYLSMENYSYLSTYKFDVGGQAEETDHKGFAYTERGIWRPGDTVHLSYLPPANDQNKVENFPTKIEVYNPQNRLVYSKVMLKGLHDIYYFPIPLATQAPTGNYRAKIRYGQEELRHNFKVENIRPERLRLKFRFPEQKFDLSQFPISLQGKVEWLMGMKAKDLRVQLKGTATGSDVYFKKYNNFLFNHERSQSTASISSTMATTKTDAEGNFELDIKKFGETLLHPVVQAQCELQAFEKGGEFTSLKGQIAYYNYDHFTGMNITKNWYKGDTALIPIVVINSKEEWVAQQQVKIEVIFRDMEQYWALRNNGGVFHEEIADKVLYSSILNLESGSATFPLYIDYTYPEYVRIKVTNLENSYITSSYKYLSTKNDEVNQNDEEEEYYYDDYDEPYRDNTPRRNAAPTTFQPQLSKDSARVGEEIYFNFSGAEGAKVLLSYEVGSRIVKQEFHECTEGNNQIKIKTDASMSPGVYLHATLLQPYAKSENDQPIRLYGIAYLHVLDKETQLKPEIILPAESAPNQILQVKIKEKNGKAMSYTLALVDEGLLSLTQFKTPNPYSFFYNKKAHQVKTWDNYAHILGAYSGTLERLYAIGGGDYDEEMAFMKNAMQDPDGRRFEPMVRYLGPFHVEARKTATHDVHVPNYIGGLRVMVIAREGKAYGSAENQVKINQELMVQMSFPKKMAPQEQVHVPVEIFNRGTKKMEVNLSAQLKGQVTLGPNPPKTVQVKGQSSEIVYLPLKTKNAGTLEVEIIAQSNGKSARQKLFSEVIHPFGSVRENTTISIAAGKSQKIDLQAKEGEKILSKQLEINAYGGLQLSNRLNYLVGYPHGCTEQILSKIRAQVALLPLMNQQSNEVNSIKKNIQFALSEVYKRQNSQGAFSYWTGSLSSDVFVSIYATMVLYELEKSGIAINKTVYNKAVQKQTALANEWRPNSEEPLLQALRLYTLAKAGKSQAAAMNRLRQSKILGEMGQLYLAAAYAHNGQWNEAKLLVKETSKRPENRNYFSDNKTITALQMEFAWLNDDAAQQRKLSQEISEWINSSQYLNTYETAALLYAITPYFIKNQPKEAVKGTWAAGATNKSFEFRTGAEQYEIPLNEKELKISNLQEKSPLNGSVVIEKILPYESDASYSENLELVLRYFDEEGKPLDVSKIKQGTDVYVEIELSKSATQSNNENFSLTFFIPSGWEFYNPRVNPNSTENTYNSSIDFQDFRDDKLLTYFNLKQNNTLKMQFRFNAAFPGKYYFGAAEAVHMYQNNIKARTQGFWVEVVQ